MSIVLSNHTNDPCTSASHARFDCRVLKKSDRGLDSTASAEVGDIACAITRRWVAYAEPGDCGVTEVSEDVRCIRVNATDAVSLLV